MRQSESLIDRADVGDTIANVDDDAGHKTCDKNEKTKQLTDEFTNLRVQRTLSVERQDGLDGNVRRVEFVLFKHHFKHLLAIVNGIEGRLGEQNSAVGGVNLQLVVEGVVPNVAHVLPIAHNACRKRVSGYALNVAVITAKKIVPFSIG